MSILTRRNFIGGTACLATLGGPLAARAEDVSAWPTRPVRFIVPLAPGGGLDYVARIVAESLSRQLGQQVYIENKTGAGGTIGIDTSIKSAPDGYSLLVTNDNVASAPHVMHLNTDYLKELVPIGMLGRQPQALAVHPSLADVKTVADLVALAKREPGMGCATSGVGSNQHVLLEWFCKRAGIRLDHVPYRGAGQAIGDFLAGHVKVAVLGPTALLPHYKAGALRIIAQSGEVRSHAMPEVPTLEESGYADLALESWYAAFAPLETPPALVAKLNAALRKTLDETTVRDGFSRGVTEPAPGTPEDLAKSARKDSDKYEKLVKELNIRVG